MTHAPRAPKEQRSFADRGARTSADAMPSDRRDAETELSDGQPGDAGVNLDTQGRFGNLRQNLTDQWKTLNR